MPDAPGKYSAGTIFLQVVPVFRDTMDAIRRETKDLSAKIGDDLEDAGRKGGQRAGKAMGEELEKEAEKSGDKAGKKYLGSFETGIKNSVKSAQKELDSLSFKDSSIALEDDFKRLQSRLNKIAKVDLKVDFDEKELLSDIAIIQGAVEALTKKDHDLRFAANLDKLGKDLATIEKRADAMVKKRRELEFGADTKPAERKLGAFEKRFKATMDKAWDSFGENGSQQLEVIRAKLLALRDAKIGIDIDADTAMARVKQIVAELKAVQSHDVNIDTDVDIASALGHLATLEAAKKIAGKDIHIKADVDADKLGLFSSLMAGFAPRANAAGSASDNAANSFRSFNFAILAIVTILPALIPMLGAVGGALLALVPIFGAVGAGIGVAVLGFSGIGAAVTELGKVADEEKVNGQQAADTARTLAAALHAVEDAERGLADARRNAAQSSADAQRSLADAIRNAARAEADAQRAIADARRNAARAEKDAARQVADARKRAADAIEAAYERQKQAADAARDAAKDVQQAEQDLADARQAAADEAASLADRQRKAALNEREAVQNLMDAQAEYNAVLADGSSTNVDKERASINLEGAQIALNDVRQEQADLTQEQADYARDGVNGNEQVKSAQEALTEAIKAQKDAQEDMTQAAQDTRDVQVQAAKDVKQALRDQIRIQKQAARDIADAQRNAARVAADSARAIADAQRNVARTAQANARAIADAERNLARARESQHDAQVKASDEMTAAQKRLTLAMDKLGPAGRHFAKFLFGLKDEFHGLRDAVQEAMLPGVESGLRRIIKTYGPQFKAFTVRMADAVGDIFADTGKGLTGKTWQRFFKTYAPLLPKLLRQFSKATGNWATAFAAIFDEVAPFAEDFSKALLDISKKVRKFFESGKGRSEVRDFMRYAADVGPDVAKFFGQMAKAFGAIAKALAPIGDTVLKALSGIFEFVANMDPKNLQALVTAALTLVIAFQIAAGMATLIAIGGVAFATTAGTVVVVAALIVGALFILYNRFEIVRKVIDALGDAVVWLWKHVIKPYLTFFVEAWQWFFKQVQKQYNTVWAPVIGKIIDVIVFLWNKVIKPYLTFIWKAFEFAFKFVKGVWDHVLWPILDLWLHIMGKLWSEVIKPILGWIGDKFEWLGGKLKKVWDDHIAPLWNGFIDIMEKHVVPKFESAIGKIAELWDGLKDKLAEPVKFLIDKVINGGIIAAFNWVARKVGSTEIDDVPTPDWVTENSHAQGTSSVLPGYTPGRDVHSFYSPTAGRLNLSGGEAILRPEVTAALGGAAAIDRLNNLSKRGIGGARAALGQGFASGGIFWPVPGRQTGTYPGHDGVDINRGSGWDDFGDPIVAAHTGAVQYVGTARGYGNSIWIKGTDGFTTLYGHTSQQHVGFGNIVQGGQLIGNVGNTGHSSAPHLHFGVYPGGTYEAALGYLSGSLQYPGTGSDGHDGGFGLPGWVGSILSGPIDWLKGRIEKPIKAMSDQFDSPYGQIVTAVPEKMVKAVGGAIKDMAQDAFSGVGHVVGGALDTIGLKDGGILPYNGTMKYDSGGYLPPGLTNVVNLTGKPEPVFTSEQFSGMSDGAGFTYAPTFAGSDLTAADVADDLDFTFRKIKRDGKYGRSKGK